MNAILSLTPAQRAHGVVVHSSGNHAGAVALAAKLINIPAYIVVPYDAPQVGPYLKPHVSTCGLLESQNVSTTMRSQRAVQGGCHQGVWRHYHAL